MRRVLGFAIVAFSVAAGRVTAGTIPDAVIVLDVWPPALPGQVSEAAPPRFALMEDGTVFVGGTSHLASGRLEKSELKDIDRDIGRVRKLSGLGSAVTLGHGTKRQRLVLRKGRPLEIVATGDTAQAPSHLKPLASLLDVLSSFDHPSLRPYRPAQYALSVRAASVPGGCRLWGFRVPPSDGLSTSVPAQAAADWPTGLTGASVCSGDKTYLVALRPLLPGERP